MSKLIGKKIKYKHLIKHETKLHILLKYLIVLSLFIIYFIFVSYKYGAKEGIYVAILSWSFFVLCTPIADAGFLIDFPIRLLTNLKMYISESFVWLIAISLNIYTFIFHTEIYDKTALLNLFKNILSQPIPFWTIILLSLLGTFVSITFGDELFDKVKHSDRKIYHKHKYSYRLFIMLFLFISVFIIYNFLLKKLGINI